MGIGIMSIDKISCASRNTSDGNTGKIAKVLEKAKKVFEERTAALSAHPRFNDASILYNPRAARR